MSDTFRKKYDTNSKKHEFAMEIKSCAEALELKFNEIGKSREISLALTDLEQSIMWATKGLFSPNKEGVQS